MRKREKQTKNTNSEQGGVVFHVFTMSFIHTNTHTKNCINNLCSFQPGEKMSISVCECEKQLLSSNAVLEITEIGPGQVKPLKISTAPNRRPCTRCVCVCVYVYVCAAC